MGALYHERGDFARAVDAYRRAIEQRPNAAATHRNLGDSLLRMGRGGEALAAYRRAADLAEAARAVNPADALNLASLAVYLQKAGDGAGGQPAPRRGAAPGARQSAGAGTARRWCTPWPGAATEALAALGRALELGYSRADAAKADEFERLRQQPGSPRWCASLTRRPAGRRVGPRLVYRWAFVSSRFQTGSFDMAARAKVKYTTIFVFPGGAKGKVRVSATPETLTVRAGDTVDWTVVNAASAAIAGRVTIRLEGKSPLKGEPEGVRAQARAAGARQGQAGRLPLQHPAQRRARCSTPKSRS